MEKADNTFFRVCEPEGNGAEEGGGWIIFLIFFLTLQSYEVTLYRYLHKYKINNGG